jgi:hypothetical protein
MADNDQFRILVGGTATNAGYAEIATADDGTEPIYVRQYTGVFSSLTRTATLLDGSGNTSFPGNVGIGTTSPVSKLEVYSGSGANYIYATNGTAATFNGLMIRYNSTDYMGAIGNPSTGEFRLGGFNASGYWTTIYSNNSETVRVTGGNVGIGTTSPGVILDVNGSGIRITNATPNVYFNNTTVQWKAYMPSNNFAINDAVRDVLTLGYNGAASYFQGCNVGIGTTSPIAKLHVSGTTGGVFEVDGAAAVNALYVSASGNVGIGTTNPSFLLNIYGSSAATVYQTPGTGTGGGNGFYVGHTSNISYLWNYNNFPLVLATNNTERMRIDSGGNVGIGTTVPSNRLEVNVSLDGAQRIAIFKNGFSTGYTSIAIDRPNTARYSFIEHTTAGTTDWYTGTGYNGGAGNSSYQISTGINLSDSKLVITTGGNVGIGTTAPTAKLHIQSGSSVVNPNSDVDDLFIETSGNSGITIGSSTSGTGNIYFGDSSVNSIGRIVYDHSGDSMRLWTNSGERFRIDSSGNVGIGTTSPRAKLHVWDSTNFGTVAIGNTTFPTLLTSNASSGEFRVDNRSSAAAGFITFYPNGQDTVSGSEAMRINTNGNVGINCTGANAKLEVVATSGEIFRADAASGAYRIVATQTGVNMNGNVGIGTTTPGSKLSIVGLPTSATGLSAGDIWNDGGTLKIV